MTTPNDILRFWFEETPEAAWWKVDPAFDDRLRARYQALLVQAAAGELQAWRGTAHGRLAEVLVLDQFPRNIHRGTPGMYTHDDLAVAATRHALTLADPLAGDLWRAVFVLMPLMHSERLDDQEEMVGRFEALAAEAERRGSPNLAAFRGNLDFARRHRDIVARFGRFPHRNRSLGRETTQQEQSFLDQGGFAG